MTAVTFEWDKRKNRLNIKNHGVSFEEAQTVFFDPLAKVTEDPDHSFHEDRLIAVGHSSLHRILLVVHCFSGINSILRIISARKLTKSERQQYEDNL